MQGLGSIGFIGLRVARVVKVFKLLLWSAGYSSSGRHA